MATGEFADLYSERGLSYAAVAENCDPPLVHLGGGYGVSEGVGYRL